MQTPQSVRLVLLLVLGVVTLSGCVAPAPTLNEAKRATTVEAIQTRVVEIREAETAAEPAAPALTVPTTSLAVDSSAVSTEQATLLAKLRPQGEAPELFNEVWLNSDPLKLADLRGQVVIVEFWTYG